MLTEADKSELAQITSDLWKCADRLAKLGDLVGHRTAAAFRDSEPAIRKTHALVNRAASNAAKSLK